jgi:hypothetical protein
MGYLLTGLGLLFIFAMLAAFYFFDRIIKEQYAASKDEWLKNGSPHGFFWVPKESTGKTKVLPKGASTRARTKHFFSWLIRTPPWIGHNKSNLLLMRALFFISLTLLVSFVILFVSK